MTTFSMGSRRLHMLKGHPVGGNLCAQLHEGMCCLRWVLAVANCHVNTGWVAWGVGGCLCMQGGLDWGEGGCVSEGLPPSLPHTIAARVVLDCTQSETYHRCTMRR